MIPSQVTDWIERTARAATEVVSRSGRPLVTLSYAQSLDGSITGQRGATFALSGAESQVFTHHLRAAHDAILVGIGTVLADNPQLTTRLVDGPDPQPVVLDSRLRFPLDARLLLHPHPPWIAAVPPFPAGRQAAIEAAGGRVLPVPPDSSGRVDLQNLLLILAEAGISSLMVEGGAEIITGFLRRRLVDRLAITLSPVLLGGLPAIQRPLDRPLPRLCDLYTTRIGEDVLLLGEPVWEPR